MNLENIEYNIENRIATITISRPEKLNALNKKTIEELFEVILQVENDNTVKCVIVTGKGDKAFVAGADIREINKLTYDEALNFSKFGQNVFDRIEKLNKPVIAAINGFALGGGCELALACHIRLASYNAKFGQPEINLGIIPGYGGTQRLTKIVNRNRALELMLTGEIIDSEEAYRIGLVNKLYAHSELLTNAKILASKIVEKSSIGISSILEASFCNEKDGVEIGMAKENELFGKTFLSEDFIEGTSAFLEKRKPNFSDK